MPSRPRDSGQIALGGSQDFAFQRTVNDKKQESQPAPHLRRPHNLLRALARLAFGTATTRAALSCGATGKLVPGTPHPKFASRGPSPSRYSGPT